MVRIIPLPHKDISEELNDDLRNKFSSIGIALYEVKLPSSQFAKLALADLDYIDKKLERYELRNKLPNIKEVLMDFFGLKRPSKESLKKARQDFEDIKKVLDTLPSPNFPFSKKK